MRILFILFLSLYFLLPVAAQPLQFQKEIQVIDSLIYMGKSGQAEKNILILRRQLAPTNKNLSLKQKVGLMQAIALILSRQEKDKEALALTLDAINKAEQNAWHDEHFKALVLVELVYETVSNLTAAKLYLNRADALGKKHNLDSLYSTYYVRLSSLFRMQQKTDSAFVYARQALAYATKYNNWQDAADANLLMGMLLPKQQYRQAIIAHRNAHAINAENGHMRYKPFMYSNIAKLFKVQGLLDSALRYSDSSIQAYAETGQQVASGLYRLRAEILEGRGELDSAILYHKKFYNAYDEEVKKNSAIELEKVAREFDNNQKQNEINEKNQWLAFALATILIILAASTLLYLQYKKIKKQNNTINLQLERVQQLLNNKEVLLAELQHRVKNNLTQVISLLEIEKEAGTTKNMYAAFTDTQNRIHAMAALHSKLHNYEEVNRDNLHEYIAELGRLVIGSYPAANVNGFKVETEVSTLGFEKTMLVGQILVELISNSLKHAFANQPAPTINIRLAYHATDNNYTLQYTDNGKGFSFNDPKHTGAGLEIIKGLARQMGGAIHTEANSDVQGFSCSLIFQ